MLVFNSEVWISGVINRMKANHCVPLAVLVARVILLMIGKKCLTDQFICDVFDEVVYADTMEGVKL
jgi:hypothetical protein